ncbi:RNA polymerase sigma factor [Actinotalea subterranea]|uniref:RNA polymerase sigma factor n=1 Tax=Actinotalea subterranea TaxID=2607497 RepID=UPI0011EF8E27|nr:RNA polymerase sigma factor [Actinotalea subterranea]
MDSPEELFTTLFESTHQALLAYAVRRVADPADAADVVAETFLVAWRRLDDVPPGDQARPWLFGVARRVLANLYRGERRRTALAERLRESLSEVVVPPDLAPVEVAMAALRPDDQELLRLVAWEELARDEIALVLGIPKATVRVRLHRARQRLAAQMAALERDGSVPPHVPAPRRAGDTQQRGPQVTRNGTDGHVVIGRAPARLGVEEAR